MKLLRLEICNIRQYEKEEIYFPPNGMIGIIGPNGSGKSTIANTIHWILYSVYEDLNNDELRNNKTHKKNPVYGVLDFKLSNSYYRIKRSLSNSELQNFVQKDGKIVASGTRNINDYIENTLFKMDSKTFKSCFYAAQDDFDALVKMNNSPRIQMLSKLLRINSIDTAASEDRDEKKLLEKELEVTKRMMFDEEKLKAEMNFYKEQKGLLEKEFSELSAQSESLKEELKVIATKVSEDEENYKLHLKLLNALETTNQKINFIKNVISDFEKQLEKINAKKDRLNELLSVNDKYLSLIEQKDSLNDKKEVYVVRFNLKKQESSVLEQRQLVHEKILRDEEQLKVLSDELNSLNEKSKDVDSLNTEVQQLNVQSHNLTYKIQELEKTIRLSEEELKNITAFDSGLPCPTCSQNMSEEHKAAEIKKRQEKLVQLSLEIDSFINQLSINKTDMKALNSKLEISKKNKAALEKVNQSYHVLMNTLEHQKNNLSIFDTQIKELQNKIGSLPDISDFKPEDYKSLLAELNTLKSSHDEFKQLSLEISSETKIKEDLSDYQSKLLEGESVLADVVKHIENLSFDENTHQTLKKNFNTKNSVYMNLLEELNSKKIHINNSTQAIQQIEDRFAQNQRELEKIKSIDNKILNLTKLDFLYKGYKGDKLAKLAPELSKMVSRLLSVATDGLFDRAVLDENNYSIQVYNNDTLMKFESFSGAQKKLIAICLRIAISQLLTTIKSSNLQMIVLDEAFGSLDLQNQDNCVQLFRRLSNVFPQIFIIAHNDYLKEQFDHTLYVEVALKEQERKSKPKWILSGESELSFDLESVKEEIYSNYSTI